MFLNIFILHFIISIHPLFLLLMLCRVTGGQELIPGNLGHKAGECSMSLNCVTYRDIKAGYKFSQFLFKIKKNICKKKKRNTKSNMKTLTATEVETRATV